MVEDEKESEVDLSDFVSERPKDMGIMVHSYRTLKIREGQEEMVIKVMNSLSKKCKTSSCP